MKNKQMCMYNEFQIADSLWSEFTEHGWILPTKAREADPHDFLLMIWDAMLPIRHHYGDHYKIAVSG